jgi:NADH:ubiquinone oxidoreductase subunit F (NADH-binding)
MDKQIKKVDIIFQTGDDYNHLDVHWTKPGTPADDIVLDLIDSGLKGRGGAGFPHRT